MPVAPDLLTGPYQAPDCHVDGWLDDEIHGRVQVGGWTHAPLSWPRRKKTGKHSPILCGDLVRAVQMESVEAICHWWGVGPTTVWKWRQALGVPQVNAGSLKLRLERHPGVPHEAAARGREKARSPESIAKSADARRGRKVSQERRESLIQWAKQPRIKFDTPGRYWSEREIKFLRRWYPRITAREIAKRLHRPIYAVHFQAWNMGLHKYLAWSAEDDAAMMRMWKSGCSAMEIALALDRTPAAVHARHSELGVTRAYKKWAKEEEKILADMWRQGYPDDRIAKFFGTTAQAIAMRRRQLGLSRYRKRRQTAGSL